MQERQASITSIGVRPEPKLQARGIGKSYGGVVALRPLDIEVYPGELLTLLGPSGSGKTTLLQLIAGLVPPSSGTLFIDGKDQTNVPASRRGIGVVFQNYSLFPHLTVEENIAFPLQMRKVAAKDIASKTRAALEMVGLDGFGRRFSSELSGGQQQRVALARCLVYQPSILLMDESLSALDRKLRETMQIEIKRIHRETGSTIIFVTHDQEEALALSDRICLMNDGRIEQIGTPLELYEQPCSEFAADFIGLSNILRGKLTPKGTILTSDGDFPLSPGQRGAAGDAVSLIIRPEHLRVTDAGDGLLSGTLTEQVYAGSETRLLVRLSSGTMLTIRQPAGFEPRSLGNLLHIRWERQNARLVPGKPQA
ncbi:ABC transporter ATP-binding protein [Mesorhizobium sp. INR15]|uniref:ABC transporter ATP-binding protein n=1 Tax=Mesorhizobium sp. INR15 TaxID=2654248 RepID=UPI0021566A46|nr:ABC transporter ATP-binding protein [Mesorhizobium sp. INR15]